jgi:hypothetical protein
MRSTFTAILLLMAFTWSYAQNGLITGRLIDWQTKKPITVAPVLVSGTTIKVYTDQEGNFRIPPFKLTKPEMIIQLLIQGQLFVTAGITANGDNYYSVVLTGMSLTKEHPEIALGEVYTVSLDNKKEISDLPCLPSKEEKYCYQLTKDKNSRDYLLVDFRVEKK